LYSSLETRCLLGAEFAVTPLRWKLDGSGDWSAAANWDGPVPAGAGSIANLTSAITAPATIALDSARTVGRLNIDNVNAFTIAGTDALTLDASGGAQVNIGAGQHTITAPLLVARDTSIRILRSASSLDVTSGISQGTSSVTLNKLGPGTLRASSIRVTTLNISGGAVKIIPTVTPNDPASTNVVKNLSIAATTKLDLASSALIVDYSAASPIAVVQSWLSDERLTSSQIVAGTGLGFAEASALGLSSFAGQPVDATALLVSLMYLGDSDMDGDVDIGDLGNLASNWQSAGGWTAGDFDYSGSVDVNDLGLLASNWQAGVGSALAPSLAEALPSLGLPSSVPEPMGLGLVIAAALKCHRHRRRK
jgi:hypothetical protein